MLPTKKAAALADMLKERFNVFNTHKECVFIQIAKKAIHVAPSPR